MSTITIENLTETDPMRREANRGLMVAWINNDLVHRCEQDVRHSLVFYDEDRLFVGAIRADDPQQTMDDINRASIRPTELARESLVRDGVRYWSVGIV